MKRKFSVKSISCVLAAAFCLIGGFGCAKEPEKPDNDTEAIVIIGSDDYAPYFYRDEDGEFAGIDVELATEAFHRIGKTAEFNEIEWEEKDILLGGGKVDCLWGCFTMTGREDRYAWAGPYMKSNQVIAVRADSDIYAFSNLEGKNIAVQATSKADEILTEGKDERFPEFGQIYCFNEFEYIFALLKNGYVDAIAGHEIALKELMKTNTGRYRILEEPFLSVKLGAAFLKGGGEEMAKLIENALRVMQNDGFTASVLRNYGLDPDKLLEADNDGWWR